eukprot:TRINITY_DN68171_c6_g1_i3.p1 TRINITY_DN68171_c6_g1~~TRINITY_DN68171_c6_g1_i3.p1  ORF type:complete len:433 (+),score=35.43 TRINITY_DN68171_c6_g1_i3:65-1363(+)
MDRGKRKRATTRQQQEKDHKPETDQNDAADEVDNSTTTPKRKRPEPESNSDSTLTKPKPLTGSGQQDTTLANNKATTKINEESNNNRRKPGTNNSVDVLSITTGPCGKHYAAVDNAFETFLGELQNIRESVELGWTKSKERRIKLQQNLDQFNTSHDNGKVVTLSIGGQRFSTMESTLMGEQESFFWSMLHSGNWTPNQQGEYFVDRSPIAFHHILEFMRSSKEIPVEKLGDIEKDQLLDDIDFYQIPSLFHLTDKPRQQQPENRMKWATDNLAPSPPTVMALKWQKLHEAVYCYPWHLIPTTIKGTVRWSVSVTRTKANIWPNNMMIGIGPLPQCTTGGAYITMNDGTLTRLNQQTQFKFSWPDGYERVTHFELDCDTAMLTISTSKTSREVQFGSVAGLAAWCVCQPGFGGAGATIGSEVTISSNRLEDQ